MSADPFLTRLDRYRVAAAVPAVWNVPDGALDPSCVLMSELEAETVAITTATGAAEALRHVLDDSCIVDGLSTAMVRAALAFLEGRV